MNSTHHTPSNLYQFNVLDSSGKEVSMANFKNKVILIVNVASKCGFTTQYSGLQELFQELGPQGLVVLAFPCNQFGSQEPGTNEEIQTFCATNFNVTFPVMAKIDVNGAQADPLFTYLKTQVPGILGTEMIKWNFTKFLVNKSGQVIKRFAPQDRPEQIKSEIQKLLS